MKLKTQAVLGLLFLSSFIKSFKYQPSAYDSVFVILITILYVAVEYFSNKSDKTEIEKLTSDLTTRLNLQDEEIERAKNTASKNAMAMGFKR